VKPANAFYGGSRVGYDALDLRATRLPLQLDTIAHGMGIMPPRWVDNKGANPRV
jgi:hypothetical protein